MKSSVTQQKQSIAQLTERYLNPPYSLPFIKAREYAMQEVHKNSEADARRSRNKSMHRGCLV